MGWPPQKLAARDVLARDIHDFALGAARVSDQGAGAQQRIEMPDGIEDAPDGLREKHQVRLAHGLASGRPRSIAPDDTASAMARSELTPTIGPANPASRRASPKDARSGPCRQSPPIA